jgi:hypothetical protein
MKSGICRAVGFALVFATLVPAAARAEFKRLQIVKRDDVLGGRPFGTLGSLAVGNP